MLHYLLQIVNLLGTIPINFPFQKAIHFSFNFPWIKYQKRKRRANCVISKSNKWIVQILHQFWWKCVICSVNTLQEHHKFLTKTEISLISDPLKSMGRFFWGFFLQKICKYLKHLSIHSVNYYIVWKDFVLGFGTKWYLNVNMQGIKEN